MDYSSEAFKENINILLLLTGSFPPKPLKTTAHGLPKISRNLSSNGPTFGKKYKKGFLFSNIGIKQSKMGTETSKIALNAHVHLRTANQHMSRPERHVDDINDMRRSCRLRENTSGRRPLGSSSRLLKVPFMTGRPYKFIFCHYVMIPLGLRLESRRHLRRLRSLRFKNPVNTGPKLMNIMERFSSNLKL